MVQDALKGIWFCKMPTYTLPSSDQSKRPRDPNMYWRRRSDVGLSHSTWLQPPTGEINNIRVSRRGSAPTAFEIRTLINELSKPQKSSSNSDIFRKGHKHCGQTGNESHPKQRHAHRFSGSQKLNEKKMASVTRRLSRSLSCDIHGHAFHCTVGPGKEKITKTTINGRRASEQENRFNLKTRRASIL